MVVVLSEANTKAKDIWVAVVKVITDAMLPGGALADVKAFVEYRRMRASQLPPFYLTVLDRRTEITEWGANRGIADLRVLFGLTGTSFKPDEVGGQLDSNAWALADLFQADVTLDGLVHDTRFESVSPDTTPPGEELTTEPWATVELVWNFAFLIGA